MELVIIDRIMINNNKKNNKEFPKSVGVILHNMASALFRKESQSITMTIGKYGNFFLSLETCITHFKIKTNCIFF